MLGSPATTETVEIGTRFRPMPWNGEIRPFFDVRAAYMHMYDTFAAPIQTFAAGESFVSGERYSRGFGGVAGAGLEFSLTRSLALTTEVSALRNRMTIYRVIGPASIPGDGRDYWMTSYRFMLGLKYNPVRVLNLVQNPRS